MYVTKRSSVCRLGESHVNGQLCACVLAKRRGRSFCMQRWFVTFSVTYFKLALVMADCNYYNGYNMLALI